MTGYVFANWRIILLAVTSIVLSVASGWTTWDGMSNFTSAPLLSFLITFGIQSVMLISAWMLGEAIVNRFRNTKVDTSHHGGLPWLLGVLLVLLALAGVASRMDAGATLHIEFVDLLSSQLFWSVFLGVGALILLVLALTGGDTPAPRLNPARALSNSAMLALMLIACMSTSVFFSFDSLFSAVFPDAERRRASEIRAQSRADTILNDLISNAQRAGLVAQARILDGPVWQAYASNIEGLRVRLVKQALALESEAAAQISQLHNKARLQDQRRTGFKLRESRVAQALVAAKAELASLQEEMRKLRAELMERDRNLLALDEEIAAKQAEAEAEVQGFGATSRPGQGPVYRDILAGKRRLEINKRRYETERRILNDRIAHLAERIAEAERGIEKHMVERAGLNADLRVFESTAVGAGSATQNEQQRNALVAATNALEEARSTFEQTLEVEALLALERHCTSASRLLDRSSDTIGGTVACTASEVRVALAPAHAMRDGMAAIKTRCRSVGNKNPAEPTPVEQSVKHARECVQQASLPDDMAAALRRRIDDIERNRDDRAHRFIVTINAFLDGNRLAYLALAIALCIDLLVFISGLLAATGRASPFTTLPGALGHTVQGADRIMRSALFPDLPRAAQQALAAIRPVAAAGDSTANDWTHEITLDARTLNGKDQLSRIINAAASIGSAQRVDGPGEVYKLRREVVDFLALHTVDPDRKGEPHSSSGPDREQLIDALGNDPQAVALAVADYLRPAEPHGDFVMMLNLNDVTPDDKASVVRALGAAALAKGAVPAGDGFSPEQYRIHRTFAEMLFGLIKSAESLRSVPPASSERGAETEDRATATKADSNRAVDAPPQPKKAAAAI